MFLGFFTPIEAAAVGAAGSFVIAFLQKEMNLHKLKMIVLETVRTSSMIFLIVAGAVIFGRFLAVSRIPFAIASFFVSLPLPGWGVMMIIILFFLFAGCFIDALALILLTIPIFYPVIIELGFDPVWFGVIVVVITQMGVITPPVGVNVYVVSGIERDIPLPEIFKGALPYLLMLLVSAVILILLPQLCLFLPGLLP